MFLCKDQVYVNVFAHPFRVNLVHFLWYCHNGFEYARCFYSTYKGVSPLNRNTCTIIHQLHTQTHTKLNLCNLILLGFPFHSFLVLLLLLLYIWISKKKIVRVYKWSSAYNWNLWEFFSSSFVYLRRCVFA